jgi:hypothetical protein
MAEQCPITEAAFHAIAHHVLETMEKHESGDAQEKEEVLAVLVSLKPDVASKSFRCPKRMTSPCATAWVPEKWPFLRHMRILSLGFLRQPGGPIHVCSSRHRSRGTSKIRAQKVQSGGPIPQTMIWRPPPVITSMTLKLRECVVLGDSRIGIVACSFPKMSFKHLVEQTTNVE